MNKIGLIIQREYLTRVRKRSFIVMTILGPILFGGMFATIIWMSTREGDEKIIEVIDESGHFDQKFQDTQELLFVYTNSNVDEAKAVLSESDRFGILHIPPLDLEQPRNIAFFSESSPGIDLVSSLEKTIKNEIEDIKLSQSGIDKETLEGLKTDIDIATIRLTDSGEKEANTGVAAFIGYIAAFMIYMFVFIYGAQVMRGVIEEKSNRIVEVIVSSVKPFQLMVGKIIGIAAVVLTQMALWIILTFGITTVIGGFMGPELAAKQQQDMEQMNQAMVTQTEVEGSMEADSSGTLYARVMSGIGTMNIANILLSLIFYFLGGYLLYAALFAAVGSASESDADTQQFMFPITIPLIIAIASLAAVLKDPHGSLAFWLSMVPFTSPVVMMMRIPFDVPLWEQLLSMVLLVLGFLFTTWLAGRIYRIGILMHGSKVNYRTLAKWFMMRN
jgi:ABC-2 type transport system permease protein